MQPAIENEDTVLLNRIAYSFHGPKRYSIIAFHPNGVKTSKIYVKRVIGLPGETIQIHDGKVYINGSVLEDDVSEDDILTAGLAAGELTLGENEYFVLGDNRNNSEDSRYANIGNIKKDYIIGKAWFRIAPFSEIGFL